jgi:hypothetical protein
MSEELNELQKQYLQDLKNEEVEELLKNADTINAFKGFCKSKGVTLTDDNFRYFQRIGIVAIYPELTRYLDENLSPDKEGLLDFKKLCQLYKNKPHMKGYLYNERFMLMAHSFFRRGHHEEANFFPRFVEIFWSFTDENIQSYIAIDRNRVRINVDDSSYMELDTWYGSTFNREIELITDGNVKLRPPLDIKQSMVSYLFHGVYSLDINWYTKERIKCFQAEEFKYEDITVHMNGNNYFPVKYIHAEYDLELKLFRHFDGAVHLYTEEEYYARRDSDFHYNYKHERKIKTLSEKLFKFNGKIKTETWVELCCHFLSGNPLVFEYFQGAYPNNIADSVEKLRKYYKNNPDAA